MQWFHYWKPFLDDAISSKIWIESCQSNPEKQRENQINLLPKYTVQNDHKIQHIYSCMSIEKSGAVSTNTKYHTDIKYIFWWEN